MLIRKTCLDDLEIVMSIYDEAKLFMKKTGNGNQWVSGYPSEELIRNDIEKGTSFVCLDDDDLVIGTFYFAIENDITYATIYEGEWLNNEPYGVVHRLAGREKVKGIARYCLNWCFERCSNIRVDTHRNNHVMQDILKKNGYQYCGIIYILDGTERLAFQKI